MTHRDRSLMKLATDEGSLGTTSIDIPAFVFSHSSEWMAQNPQRGWCKNPNQTQYHYIPETDQLLLMYYGKRTYDPFSRGSSKIKKEKSSTTVGQVNYERLQRKYNTLPTIRRHQEAITQYASEVRKRRHQRMLGKRTRMTNIEETPGTTNTTTMTKTNPKMSSTRSTKCILVPMHFPIVGPPVVAHTF